MKSPPHPQHTALDQTFRIDRILRLPEVVTITGLSKATIYRMVAAGTFPRPLQLGKQSTGWKRSAVEEWIEDLRPAESGLDRSDE